MNFNSTKDLLLKLTEHIPYRRKLFSGALWAFSLRMLSVVLGIAMLALLSRMLPAEDMGVYFIVFSIVQTAVIISQLGLNQTIVRIVASSIGLNQQGIAKSAIVKIFKYCTASALLISAIYYFGLARFLSEQVFHSRLILTIAGPVALWIIILTYQRLMAEAFRGFHDIRLASTFGGFVTALLTVFFLFYIYSGQQTQGEASLNEIIIVILVAATISAAIAALFLRAKTRSLQGKEEIQHKELWSTIGILLSCNIVNVLIMRSDIWMVGGLMTPEDAALYGAAARLITLILLPTMIISAVVPPMIAELYAQRDLKKLENILRGTATLSAIPSFFILMIFIFSGETILELTYGSEFYHNAGKVLAILSGAQLVSIWAGPCAQLLLMSNNTKALLVINLSALIIAISLALIFTPMYGMTGIASSYAIATILLNIAMASYCSKKIGVKTHAKFSTSVFRLILERKSRVRAPNIS